MKEELAKKIEELYGKPCIEHDPDCVSCRVWETYNELMAHIETAEAEIQESGQ